MNCCEKNLFLVLLLVKPVYVSIDFVIFLGHFCFVDYTFGQAFTTSGARVSSSAAALQDTNG